MASAAATPAASAAAEAASAAASGTLIKLHGFPASPTSMLARMTLNLKGVPYEFIPLAAASSTSGGASSTTGGARTTVSVGGIGESAALGEGSGSGHHVDDGGGSMPWLEDGGHRVTQTGAIFNYINEMYPRPPLLPKDATARATVRSIATYVACEIQPFGFYRVVRYLMDEGGKSPEWVRDWRRHWLQEGFGNVESKLVEINLRPGRYCYGDLPTMADVFLIPQVHISQGANIGFDLKDFPYIKRIYDNCLTNPAFKDAFPVDG